ncbi:undecaprenyl-diphosphatase [Cnuibacter physcomitrellae]|uniref:Undecaprenyl-diphosphatase n=1 Tax=Cnuibacter physcomitrellae TaxID=1619308 RepID=A0A1X9LUB8_9MICO|nr:undecaprenyl-diphosphate phosphatase [Cnuibacter physcomitrellae]ARJ07601.1 UDP-diphosphatase [Cnuibacter physcomitrellae]GGI42832.1 undecaprenyl-diphosphatase [Cnuibacter physcomitrellae]
MNTLAALLLGLVQGLTEFLPVSSSAHIRVVGELIGTGADPGAAFTAIIQLGTEAAVIVYFWRDIARIVSRWARSLLGRVPRCDPDALLGWYIILGSLPIVVLGVAFQTQIETVFRSLWIVAGTLIVFGILLGIADRVGTKTRTLRDLTWRHAIVYGLAQALALVPGVSRSGGTITGGLLLGYSRAAAARYSFLLAIPAVLGSGLYELVKLVTKPCQDSCVPELFGPVDTALATVVAFLVGLLVIRFFLAFISRYSFLPFVIYRILLGAALIVALSVGVLQP